MTNLEQSLNELYDQVQYYRKLIGDYNNELKGLKVKESQLMNMISNLTEYEDKFNAQSMLIELRDRIHEIDIQITVYKGYLNSTENEYRKITNQIECNEIMDNICKSGYYNW